MLTPQAIVNCGIMNVDNETLKQLAVWRYHGSCLTGHKFLVTTVAPCRRAAWCEAMHVLVPRQVLL